MISAARRFLVGGIVAGVGGGVAFAAMATGRDPHVDAIHFVSVGVGAFALGCVLVHWHPELAPDPAMRKGVAPRAFWTLCAGVILRGVLGSPDPEKQAFLASLSMAGMLLEAAALAMLLYGAFIDRGRLPEKPPVP